MATPHVAGAFALLRQRNPSAGVTAMLSALSATGTLVTDTRNGVARPRIQVDAALEAVAGPELAIDAPAGGTVSQPFDVAGWAIDRAAAAGTGVDAVHVHAYPAQGGTPVFVGAADYAAPRPDVAAHFGSQFANSGFRVTVTSLPAGAYTLAAFPHSSVTGTFGPARTVNVTIASTTRTQIDLPRSGDTVGLPFVIAGWALDQGSTNNGGVDTLHVYAYPLDTGGAPLFVGSTTPATPRPDVGAAFGAQFSSSGYQILVQALPAGRYRLAVFAHSAITGQFAPAATADVTVLPRAPLVTIDGPSPGSTVTRPFILGGWAIDPRGSSGSGIDAVHVWAFPVAGGSPIFIGAATLGGMRPDVAAAYGVQFSAPGFGLRITTLPPGEYRLAAYAHSAVSGEFVAAAQVRVIVL